MKGYVQLEYETPLEALPETTKAHFKAHDLRVIILKTFVDQKTAATDTLQDVLDMVRQCGNGLSHGSQTLGLYKRGVVGRVFNC